MNTVLAKNGVRHNMEVLFSDLQSYTSSALVTILTGLIETYGIMAEPGQDDIVIGGDTSLKVSYTTQGSVNIASGLAITSDLGFINVGSTSKALPAGSGIHTLYVRHVGLETTPSTILNGFYFNPGETTSNTRFVDTYEFVWDVATSGLLLADVYFTTPGVVYQITDRRHENLLTLRSDVFPNKILRTDWTDLQTMLSELAVKNSLKVADGTTTNSIEFVTSGTEVGPVIVDAEDVKLSTDRQHLQNTDTGTTASSFKVGVGSLGPGGVGLNALTEPDTPSNVKNFRIVDISGGNNDVFYGTTSKGKLKQGLTKKRGDQGHITVAWGYDGIVGSGTTLGRFTIDHTSNVYSKGIDGGVGYANATFTGDELVGHWLYIPSQGTSYKIISNDATAANATLLEVTTAGGSVPNLTGITTTTGTRGSIHNGCDTYNVRMVPVLAASTSTEVIAAQQTAAVTKDGTLDIHAALKTTFAVPLGWLVNFYITAASANLVNSSEVTMSSGSFVKPTNTSKYSSNPVTYAVPTPLELPLVSPGYSGPIDTVNGSAANDYHTSLTKVTAVSTPNGFAIALTLDTAGGWDLADEYEYVYTTDNAGADFANPIHERYVTAERWIDVAASGTRTYSIKVRPLLCGQTIGSALSTSVTSGSGGQSPTDTVIVQFPVNLKTFSGTMTYSSGAEAWQVATLQSPANSAIVSPTQNAIPASSVLVDNATVITTAVLIPAVSTYSITLDVGNTANFAASGTVYLQRQSTGSTTYYSVVYTSKTANSLIGVHMSTAATLQVYVGDLLTYGTTFHEFLVNEVGSNYIELTPLDGVSSPTAGTFVANVTKRGRMLLYQTGMPLDFNVTRGFMDLDIIKGAKARLRWFQDTLETSNDSLAVSSNDTPYYQDSDVTIFAENNINGIRTVIVDAFDDTADHNNVSNINGTFTLYGRPRSKADKNFESEFALAKVS